MRKLTWWLLTVLLVFITLTSYELVNPARAFPNCNITNLTTQVGNGTVSYRQVGSGQIILLLHGLFANKEQWNSLMCRLSEAGYRTIAPDLPGYGNSKGFEIKDYALENQATLIHEFVNSLGINSFELAGNSMGGTIAYIYTQRYSNQVHSAVPTLIIWGKEDRIYDVRGANQLQQHLAGSQLILLPKAGHLPQLEIVEEVGSQYLHFLQNNN